MKHIKLFIESIDEETLLKSNTYYVLQKITTDPDHLDDRFIAKINYIKPAKKNYWKKEINYTLIYVINNNILRKRDRDSVLVTGSVENFMYKIHYSSESLEDCVNYLEQYIAQKKYNL
jgi:hypothetical protein